MSDWKNSLKRASDIQSTPQNRSATQKVNTDRNTASGVNNSGGWKDSLGRVSESRANREPRKRREYEDAVDLVLKDGRNLGRISKDAYDAIVDGMLDSYVPKDHEERKSLDIYRDYENNSLVELQISPTKTIKLKYGTVKALDKAAAPLESGKTNSAAQKKRVEALDSALEALKLSPEEYKAAKSYAGIKKLEIANRSTGENSVWKEITQPLAKGLAGMFDAAEGASRFIIKSGFNGLLEDGWGKGEYNKFWREAENYYSENPDALGHAIFDRNSNSNINSDYVDKIAREMTLTWWDDTSKPTKWISDVGFRSAGNFLGSMAMADASGLSGAMSGVSQVIKGATSGTKAGKALSAVANLSPKIKPLPAGGKVINGAINRVNNITLGAAAKFLNPLDNPTTLLMGANAAQEKYDRLIAQGVDDDVATANSLFTGYISAITEKMGYDGTARTMFNIGGRNIAGDATASVVKNAGNFLKHSIPRNASEGLEEVYSLVFERGADYFAEIGYVDEEGRVKPRKFVGKEGVIDFGGMVENFAGGYVGGAVIGSTQILSDIANMDINTVKEFGTEIKRQVDAMHTQIKKSAEDAGVEVNLPETPDFKTASVEELGDFYEKSVEEYKKIVTDEDVIVNDEKVLTQNLGNAFEDELSEIAAAEIPAVKVGDSFIDNKTGNTIRIVNRDSDNTVVEIDTGKTVESRTYTNKQADTLTVNDQYTPVKPTPELNPQTETETTNNDAAKVENSENYDAAPEAADKPKQAEPASNSALTEAYREDADGNLRFNQAELNYENKTLKKGDFYIAANVSQGRELVSGQTLGAYGIHKNKVGTYTVTHLETGMGISSFSTATEAKKFAEYIEANIPHQSIPITKYLSGKVAPKLDDASKEYTSKLKEILNSKAYLNEPVSEISDGKVPFSTKKDLINYVKAHAGEKVKVSFSNGKSEIRSLGSVANSAMQTVSDDGTTNRVDLKGLTFNESGFSVTFDNGTSVSYDFVNTSEETAVAEVAAPASEGVGEHNIKADTLAELHNSITVEKMQHSKTGEDIWVVRLKNRLGKEDFDTVRNRAKALGGYWSNFVPDKKGGGFVFKTNPTVEALELMTSGMPLEAEAGRAPEDFTSTVVAAEGKTVLQNENADDIIKSEDEAPASEDGDASAVSGEDEVSARSIKSKEVADFVANKLAKGEKISAKELFDVATKAFGGTMSDNVFSSKDAYDAMELGVNQHILTLKDVSADKMLRLLELLPTQTKRTEGMEKFQQFSTPPSIAYVANDAANINDSDLMLEPSAGIGGIAVFAKKAGAKVVVNELDPRRLEIIKNLPFDGFYNEDAEQLDNILGDKIEPTVIVMNPPFSSSAERNMQGTKIGAKHIEQALKILAPNGRLVAIVGRGMAHGEPAFRSWWKGIESEYTVRADVGLDGKNYNKYGTNFDIRILVIDKTGATTEPPITGKANTINELESLLGGIKNERPKIGDKRAELKEVQPTRSNTAKRSESESDSSGRGAVSDTGSSSDNERRADNELSERESKPQNVQPDVRGSSEPTPSESSDSAAVAVSTDGRDGRESERSAELREPSGTSDTAGEQPDISQGRTGSDGEVGRRTPRVKKKELTDSIFESYQTQPLAVKGAKAHPAKVSESAAMSAIEPPVITYKPAIPQSIIEKGVLSDVQLEAISYAGQSHSQTLANGNSRGFFLGDGTGIGKGRTIAGVMLDNYNKGKKKAVWVTLNSSLVNDAKRDVKAVFGSSDLVTAFAGGNKAESILKADEGIMVIGYSTLAKEYDKKDSNLERLVKWLGPDFDGVIAFDEAHKMGNACDTKGTRGVKKASKTGLAGIALQNALPKAKIVYASATGATEVENLRYAERLGLWGDGTAFATGEEFVSKIKAGGLAAMELIARDMKAMGVYLSRNISYEDVVYDKITHKLTAEQRKIYDELAKGWQIVLQNTNKALEITNQAKDGEARGRALGKFWSSQQRFFNQILTSMQVPSVISDIEKELADGKSCVIQLVSTNEAAQNREFERLKEEDLELEDFDLTPKQMLMSYIESAFPVQQYEEYRDDDGNVRSKAVFDSKGQPVLNRDAVRQREELLSKLGSIKVPSSPIDMIINHFGSDMVAENTGRSRRIIEKNGKTVEEKIANKKDADVDAFQNGKKRIMIFSKAGGTGKSYHADKTAKNQQQRVHYLLEAGWQADNAVQGFGRTHRSNQASAPIFKLVTTDLKGQMRFISTIAKRLDQLGAMTKGQRQAGSQGMFSASDNLENSLAADVLALFYKDLYHNKVAGVTNGLDIIEKLGLKDKLIDQYGQLSATAPELREVNKFLNRILTLDSTEQNIVFEGYSERLEVANEKAAQEGTLDRGLENYKADKVSINDVQDIRTDPKSGAKTKYYSLTAQHKIKPVAFESIQTGSSNFVGFYQNNNSGAIRAVFNTSSTTDKFGNVSENCRFTGQVRSEYGPKYTLRNWTQVDAAEAKKLWEEAITKLPEYRSEDLHLISGVVLPVWDKLPTENVRIYRVLADNGEMLIGRVISDEMIDETLRRLDAVRAKKKIPSTDLINGIKNGDTVHLDNGWKVVQRKVSGENRIELVGPDYHSYDRLQSKGVFTERIQYATRFFIPTGTEAVNVLNAVLEMSPVARVENIKYSIESEDMSDGESTLPDRGRGRHVSKSARRKIKKLDGRTSRYKESGKTRRERLERCRELKNDGVTQSQKISGHLCEVIPESAYDKRMRRLVDQCKKMGFDNVGLTVGAIQIPDVSDSKGKPATARGIYVEDGGKHTIIIQYDNWNYQPEQIRDHESVHLHSENKTTLRAKVLIWDSLSKSEQNDILDTYSSLYKGISEDKAYLIEEFTATVLSGMGMYSVEFADLIHSYWNSPEDLFDKYDVSRYNTLMDTGDTNEEVLENIGLGNDMSEQEYALLSSAIMAKNAGTKESKLKPIDYVFAADKFYVYRNKSSGVFEKVLEFDAATAADRIKLVMEAIDSVKFINTDRTGLNTWLKDIWSRTRSYNRDNDSAKRRRLSVADDRFYGNTSTGNTGRYSGRTGEDYQKSIIKYSLSPLDTDIKELTPERKKEILKQFEKDRVGLDKVSAKQAWGERAAWIAHNMTRVFPEIPERGERGTFFAEFRKNMIQWKALPTTASFMTQNNLNKMVEGLNSEEFKTFSELVYFLDLQEEAKLQKERGYTEILLPNEISPGEVDAIVAELNSEASDAVKKALETRQMIWDGLKEQYIRLNQYVGFNTENKFKRKNYYHHQVIEHMAKANKGTGKRAVEIKAGRGWLKERHGSTKAINTDFLAVEYMALLQMQYDVYVADMLGKIKNQYDIKPQLEHQAFENNKTELNKIIASECADEDGNIRLNSKGKPDSETYRQQQWYNSRIMFGFSGLFDLADRNALPAFDGQYAGVIATLKRHELNAADLYKYVGDIAATPLPEYYTDAQEQAQMNARTILKYTSQKKAWIKELLADKYQTWESIAQSMSDTHAIHQPRRGNYFYTKTTVDEDAFNKAFNDMVATLASGDTGVATEEGLKEVFSRYSDTVRLMGAAFEEWVIPKEIVSTMDSVANPKQAGEGAKMARAIVSAWKGWATSVNPLRTVKFGLRNIWGDFDAVLAGNPMILTKSKRAVQEIYEAMRHKKYSDDFMKWAERGGYSSMIFANEMDSEMQDKLFAHLKDKDGINIFKIPAKILEGYYDAVETVHNFREAILRYSAFLYYKDAIERSGGKVKSSVASNRYIISGLHSTEDKAYQLSKDLLGAYDEVGMMGQTLRRYWVPFYSFTETNLKRYYRMFDNIINSDDSIPKKAGKLLIKGVMVNALALILTAWNKLVMDEEDEQLPPSVRNVPHITLGKIGDDIYAFRQLGSFSELLEWFGLEDYKWTKEDLVAPVDKAWGMITPFVKMPIELASGLNFYPSLTQPRAIRDKADHLFNSFGLSDLYREVTGKPTQGVGKIIKGAFVYTYDYKESAYYELLDIKRNYQGKNDSAIYGSDKKSNALYYMKQAVRYKDKDAALKYLDQYFECGGTGKGITQSFATLNPMYGYTGKDTVAKGEAFIASLNKEELEKLRIAQKFYEEDLMLPEDVAKLLRKKDITDTEAKNLLRTYINSKCK